MFNRTVVISEESLELIADPRLGIQAGGTEYDGLSFRVDLGTLYSVLGLRAERLSFNFDMSCPDGATSHHHLETVHLSSRFDFLKYFDFKLTNGVDGVNELAKEGANNPIHVVN